MRTTARGSQFYSPANRAPVVPSSATEVGRSTTSAGTVVTYRTAAGSTYTVTYAPSGKYTYTVGGAAGARGSLGTTGSTGTTSATGATSTTGTTGTTTATGTTSLAGGGTTTSPRVLPRTGGAVGAAPALPMIPAFLGLMLVGLGFLARRLALAVR